MSSFFTTPASQRKRKRGDERAVKSVKRRGVEGEDLQKARTSDRTRPSRTAERDDSISGSESDDDNDDDAGTGSESEATSEEGETGAERRVRLAQRYLDNIRQEVDEAGFDAEEIDKDLIAQRLKEDVDEATGRQFRLIAQSIDFKRAEHTYFRAGDTQATTAVAVRQPYVYTVSKDKALVKWQLQDPSKTQSHVSASKKPAPPRRKPKQVAYVRGVKISASSTQQHGHTGAILSVAVSPDGNFVATGGADKKLIIWAAEDLRPLKTFMTHRDAVTGLDFAPTASESGFGAQLFSASMDRSLKTYSLSGNDSLAYVETLFGHQDHVLAVSAMAMDQCVSIGARDRSARLWRVVEETQLKFLGDSSRNDVYHTGSLDCVAALPPHHFVTGSDSGAISLWSIHKKKAVYTIRTAHGVDEPPPLEQVTSEQDPEVIQRLSNSDTRVPIPRPITALAALPGTDIILSGSWDGRIRVWKLSDDKRTLGEVGMMGKPIEDSLSLANGITGGGMAIDGGDHTDSSNDNSIRGVVNSIAVFERRKQIASEFGGTKDGECLGLCVIAGTGKEMRLGRWTKFPKGRNGAVVFEVPLLHS